EDRYDFKYKSDGIGFEGLAGWKISSGKVNSVNLELGYSLIPVSIMEINSFYSYSGKKNVTKNFGRIFFNIAGSFGLGDY
ncbi:MAG: hypothetical protein ABI840_05605, partial [bacterium]